jgi:hypothetical protein
MGDHQDKILPTPNHRAGVLFSHMGAKTPFQEFDQFAHSYDESLDDGLRRIFAAGTQFFHRRKLQLLLKILRDENLNPGNLHWIDIGCAKAIFSS